MLLYTAMPLELVLEGIDKTYDFKEVELGNIKLLVEPIDMNRGRIVRLLSTNPQDYLNPKYTPGTILEYKMNAG